MGGVAFFDDNDWIVYDEFNSDLPSNSISSLAIDNSGIIWVGTNGRGVASFDGDIWTVYDNSNSGLPGNVIESIQIDANGTKWIGTGYDGLASFDGTNWTTYNESNSGLPNNSIHSLAIDSSGYKWIGTEFGLAVFNEGGFILGIGDDVQNRGLSSNFRLHQNYPNPFNPTTTISYDLPEQSTVKLTVFDIQGRDVRVLWDAVEAPGNYEVHWNGLDYSGNQVSTGVYFCRLQAGPYSKTIKMVYLR